MKERLEIIQERYDYLCNELLKPEIYEDYKKIQVVSKEKNSIEPIVNAYKKYNTILDDIEAAKEMAHDPEMKDFANEELENFNFKCQEFENIELEKNDLLVANFSIPFCNKDYFNEFWNKISNSILKVRIFCWKFFWIKRFLGKYKRANGIFIKRASVGII